MKLHQGKFRLDTRKRFFTETAVSHWNRLPREIIMAPRLPEFLKLIAKPLGFAFTSINTY